MRKAKYIGRKVNPLNFYVTASPSKKSRDQSDHRCTTRIILLLLCKYRVIALRRKTRRSRSMIAKVEQIAVAVHHRGNVILKIHGAATCFFTRIECPEE